MSCGGLVTVPGWGQCQPGDRDTSRTPGDVGRGQRCQGGTRPYLSPPRCPQGHPGCEQRARDTPGVASGGWHRLGTRWGLGDGTGDTGGGRGWRCHVLVASGTGVALPRRGDIGDRCGTYRGGSAVSGSKAALVALNPPGTGDRGHRDGTVTAGMALGWHCHHRDGTGVAVTHRNGSVARDGIGTEGTRVATSALGWHCHTGMAPGWHRGGPGTAGMAPGWHCHHRGGPGTAGSLPAAWGTPGRHRREVALALSQCPCVTHTGTATPCHPELPNSRVCPQIRTWAGTATLCHLVPKSVPPHAPKFPVLSPNSHPGVTSRWHRLPVPRRAPNSRFCRQIRPRGCPLMPPCAQAVPPSPRIPGFPCPVSVPGPAAIDPSIDRVNDRSGLYGRARG